MIHRYFVPRLMLSLTLTPVALGGCTNSSALSPEQATGTAIVAQKDTAAVKMDYNFIRFVFMMRVARR